MTARTGAADGAAPRLSLVTCTLGRTEPLARLLRSLAAQPAGAFEFVLVDQNPPGFLDGVIAEADAGLPLTRITSPRGLSVGRNAGLSRARGALIGFPDDDCWYDPGTVEAVLALFDDLPDTGVLIGRTLDAGGAESVTRAPPADRRITAETALEAGNSNALFLRRAAVERVGGFDERLGVGAGTPFGSGEETDILLRALAAGFRADYRRDLVVRHDQPAATVSRVEAARRIGPYARGTGALLRKHGLGARTGVQLIARTALGTLKRALRGEPPAFREKTAYIAGLVAGYRRWPAP
ncbi:MAG: glycosyltransferase [Azospirillaceae bacterium]